MHLAPCGGKPCDGQSWSAVLKIFEDESPIVLDGSESAEDHEAGKLEKLLRTAARVLHRAIHGIRGAREEMIQLHYEEVPSAESYFQAHVDLHEGLARLKFKELQQLGEPPPVDPEEVLPLTCSSTAQYSKCTMKSGDTRDGYDDCFRISSCQKKNYSFPRAG